MLFLAGIDGTMLGVVLMWHGLIEGNFGLLLFGCAVSFVANVMIFVERDKRMRKMFDKLKEMQKRS